MPTLDPFLAMAALPRNFIDQGNFRPSDSVEYAILAVDTAALLLAVVIAIWKHRDLRRYRKADHESAAVRAEQDRLQQLRRDRRESWEPVFREIDETLKKLEDIESEVREQGPVDSDIIGAVELGRIQRRLQNMSQRCPEALREPLRDVAAGVDKLRGIVIYSDTQVILEYTKSLSSVPQAAVAPEVMASALGSKAIEQYRAAADLHLAIAAAWDSVYTERGGES